MNALNKAEELLLRVEHDRRLIEAGRRESDRELQHMAGYLDLAMTLLRESIQMNERGTFEASEMNSLKMGLELLEGFKHDTGNCGNRDSIHLPCGSCQSCERQGRNEVFDTGLQVQSESV